MRRIKPLIAITIILTAFFVGFSIVDESVKSGWEQDKTDLEDCQRWAEENATREYQKSLDYGKNRTEARRRALNEYEMTHALCAHRVTEQMREDN